MKLTYQKDGVALKHKLKKLQQTNLRLWLVVKIFFVFFLLALGFYFHTETKSPLANLDIPSFSIEEQSVQIHHRDALTLLENHQAPSIILEIIDQFVTHKDLLREVSYQRNPQYISVELTFSEMTPEKRDFELLTLTQSNLFTKIDSSSDNSAENTFIFGRIPNDVFLFKNTTPLLTTSN